MVVVMVWQDDDHLLLSTVIHLINAILGAFVLSSNAGQERRLRFEKENCIGLAHCYVHI